MVGDWSLKFGVQVVHRSVAVLQLTCMMFFLKNLAKKEIKEKPLPALHNGNVTYHFFIFIYVALGLN